jgi:hypothetical protein
MTITGKAVIGQIDIEKLERRNKQAREGADRYWKEYNAKLTLLLGAIRKFAESDVECVQLYEKAMKELLALKSDHERADEIGTVRMMLQRKKPSYDKNGRARTQTGALMKKRIR